MSSKTPNWELIEHKLDELAKSREEDKLRGKSIEKKMEELIALTTNFNEMKDWKKEVQDAVSPSELKDIKEWKKRVDEVASPTQFKMLMDDVSQLKVFKNQATTIWIVVQALMGIVLFISDIMG
jgi:hypothetical protein